jgi:hypothetical protein
VNILVSDGEGELRFGRVDGFERGSREAGEGRREADGGGEGRVFGVGEVSGELAEVSFVGAL